MSARVARQRHQHEAGGDLCQLLRGGEPTPGFTVDGVLDDLGSVCPLGATEPDSVAERAGPHGAEGFRSGDVDLRVGEIRDTADVIGVEVGDDDVADVGVSVPELLDLAEGGFGRIERRPEEVSADPPEACGPAAVEGAEAGVDQDQPSRRLDQQYVTHQRARPQRPHRAAVQVMNLHGCPPRP